MKNKLMKKVAVGALTTAVVASQLATTIPYNVFAAETTTQETQATTSKYTVNPVVATDTKVTGTVDPTIPGTVQIGSRDAFIVKSWDYKVDAAGNFETTIDRHPVGDLLTVNFGTSGGQIKQQFVRVGGGGYNQEMVLNPITLNSTTVSGKALPYSYVQIIINGVKFGRLTDLQGNFTCDIPEEVTLKVGDTATLSYDSYYENGYANIADAEISTHGADTDSVTIIGDTTKPVITASNKTLTVGDSFDPKAGVSASDDTDGNITSKIAVTSNNVDTSKAGTYTVSYSVTDAAGNVGTKTITVTVNEAPDTTNPVITASNKTLTVG
ncbi:DUF5011 domain-containing protein, partial [Listeria booriae]|uniref:immunoglobulin-like domain-containing protein n=1 Tax=Listeria booriae TaxID=1552123 RepID=UPI0016236921